MWVNHVQGIKSSAGLKVEGIYISSHLIKCRACSSRKRKDDDERNLSPCLSLSRPPYDDPYLTENKKRNEEEGMKKNNFPSSVMTCQEQSHEINQSDRLARHIILAHQDR